MTAAPPPEGLGREAAATSTTTLAPVSDASPASSNPSERETPEEEDATPVRELVHWERWVAGFAGAAAAGAGGFSVFVSDNQAGSTALMVFGAVFLLLAVQGTAIRRATRESVEMERRSAPRRIVTEAREKINAGEPDQARAYIEGASESSPEVADDDRVLLAAGYAYAEQISETLLRLARRKPNFDVIIGRQHAEVFVRNRMDPDRAAIRVDAKYTLRRRQHYTSLSWLRAHFERARQVSPAVVVSNFPLSPSATSWMISQTEYPLVRYAVWGDSEDDSNIERALDALFEEMERRKLRPAD